LTTTAKTSGTIIQSWVPAALAVELKRRAAAERRSVSSVIRIAVEDQLRRAQEDER
jgi:hypothetical protein